MFDILVGVQNFKPLQKAHFSATSCKIFSALINNCEYTQITHKGE